MSTRISLALAVVCLLGVSILPAGDAKQHFMHHVAIEDSRDYGYCNGALLTDGQHRPILSFSLHKPAKGKTRFVYLLIFKAPPGPRENRYELATGPGGNSTNADGAARRSLSVGINVMPPASTRASVAVERLLASDTLFGR